MSLSVIKPGILSTVQDLGRVGYARFGINRSGAMDPAAARITNILVGNCESEAVLEMHFPAPELKFERDTLFALGGADFSALLDQAEVENWRPMVARKGDVLRFRRRILGNRAYFAVRGGLDGDEWLGSRSTNLNAKLGGLGGRKIAAGDILRFSRVLDSPATAPRISVSRSLIPRYSAFPTVRITKGAEFDLLPGSARSAFFETDFTVTRKSDRMGFRLCGEPLVIAPQLEMVSSAVNFGTIQRLPDGQLIILMADHQTSGGYPRIAHIVPTDLALAGQLGATDKLAFFRVSVNEAEETVLRFDRDLKMLAAACRLHFH